MIDHTRGILLDYMTFARLERGKLFQTFQRDILRGHGDVKVYMIKSSDDIAVSLDERTLHSKRRIVARWTVPFSIGITGLSISILSPADDQVISRVKSTTNQHFARLSVCGFRRLPVTWIDSAVVGIGVQHQLCQVHNPTIME